MSLISPVGPEPPGVYWRRRLAVLLALLLVLGAFWFFFLRGRGADSSTPSASGSPKPTSTATASPSGSSSKSPTAKPTDDCADSDVSVTVALDGTTFPAGDPVTITQTITNIGDVACQRDIGAKANTISITSGGYPVWSSDDCSPGGSSNVVVMKPGEGYQVTVSWKGVVTEGRCPDNPPKAQPGSYEAQGKNGEVVSKKKTFALT